MKSAELTNIVVIFGASGDLTKRKLIPAFYNLQAEQNLPPSTHIIGASRTKFTHEQYRVQMQESTQQFSRSGLNQDIWSEFAKKLFYCPTDINESSDIENLKGKILELAGGSLEAVNLIFYLSTAPKHFANTARQLKNAGLIFEHRRNHPQSVNEPSARSVVVLEKPFGSNLKTAQELNHELRKYLAEEQIYRIDHYLGKEAVQNILLFRFTNGIFEPLWNRRYIDHIQISVCETIGVESRADYFDQTGILRDIIQNHLLQVLALLCIEPPASLTDSNSIRDEKVKVLKSLKRLSVSEVSKRTIRAQYTEGQINNTDVIAYTDEKDVSDTSQTESYFAMKLKIDNWRWAGVPIYIRSGKRLTKRITEASIVFKSAPKSILGTKAKLEPNTLRLRIQPDEGISVKINSKPPGENFAVSPVNLDFTYQEEFSVSAPEAYERLLLDSIEGDSTLFIRDDEIEAAWDFLEPVFQAWSSKNPPELFKYPAGTWGPNAADNLLGQQKHSWLKIGE